jgi:hypothetical protein
MKIIAGCCITKDCASVFQSHELLDIRFVLHKGLAGFWRITLTEKLTTGYPGGSIAYQLHIIDLHKKHY